ncbi:ATP-binding cassette domain-containing protein [Demequina mangrovi]|uniref:ATPase components of ABC transporters with duplicated ATPase domains n=1 Tax=Demequina mangrovi TaxID=1043493 RepID=A0A1H6VXR7_9MICO|nr:ATP-binding cassette domain-containing protein [Demequina mangrovi]SEJ08506.1 ATPase components of ABC transporters with duplicated ATPase domains [Demequina mangrovi]
MQHLSFSRVAFAWPDGRALFTDLDLAIPDGLTALIGRNGIGKSTLVRLALGELRPTAGSVVLPASVAHVPQHVAIATGTTVAEALGVAARVAALRAIEAGATDPDVYDALADDWSVEERAAAMLASLGLPTDLDRTVDALSGGEAVLLAVAAALLARPDLLVLDEPTNNLDAEARAALAARLSARDGATLVVSHDRELLARVDRIAELCERDDRTVELRWFGGAVDALDEAREAERAGAAQALASANAAVARQSAALAAHADGAGRKRRAGEKARVQRRVVGLAADAKQGQAERTDARVRRIHQQRLAEARDRLAEARAAIPRDRTIRIDLPGTAVPPRRLVLEAEGLVTRTGATLDALVRGPERVHVTGRNGAGKSTLVATLLGDLEARGGRAHLAVPVGILPQRLVGLDEGASVLENVRMRASGASGQEVRDLLGRFRFRGASADAAVATLSGGERFRAFLACALLARPEPQLLVLDEPTNSLDLESQAQLVEALAGYRGALLVASHDTAFVEAVGPTREWRVVPGEPVGDRLLN